MLNRGAMFCATMLIAVSSAAGQTLSVGDKAPALSIDSFVKGKSVTGFEAGKPYVVEFWRTWCPPCRKSIPHLTELQAEYADDGLTIIGISNTDSRGEDLEKVEAFVEEWAGKMDYTIAFDEDRSMWKTWADPAGLRGIPSAFVVDGTGTIAWIGNPLASDFDQAVADAVESAASAAERPFALMIGDKAPKLDIGEWVQGEPITGFEKGRTYVVEFWATWCGPCINGMPHVSKLQEKYKNKGVQIVGVNIWDDPANVAPFMKDRGDKPSGEELMNYTVAIETKGDITKGDKIENGIMSETWMNAAGRNGIPSAFIVNGEGRIAWMGHPGSMDKPLAQIVAGEWDIDAALERYLNELKARANAEKFQSLFKNGDYADAYKLGNSLMNEEVFWDNPGFLNMVAWRIVDPDNTPEIQDLKLALKAAKRANDLTDNEDAGILDTLATVYAAMGKMIKAIEIQTRAVKMAEGTDMEADLQDRLDEFTKKAKGQG